MVEFLDADDADEEKEPRGPGGHRAWLLGVVALVGVVVAVVALDHGASPTRRTDLATARPQPDVTTAPPRFATDVLVYGGGSETESGPGQIGLGTDVRNISTTEDIRIAYPITVMLPQGASPTVVTAGIRPEDGTSARIVTIPPGQTVMLWVSMRIDCAHPALLADLVKDGVRASVRIAQATGAATFTLTPIGSYRDMLHETCPALR